MAFNGRWKKIEAKNVDETVKQMAPDAPAPVVAKIREHFASLDEVEELKIEGDTIERKTYVGGKLTKEFKNQMGKDTELVTPMGKSTINGKMVSNTRIESTETTSDGQVRTMVLRAEGDKIYYEYTVNGVTMVRVYKKE